MNQEVTFLSDGGESVRDLQLYMRPNAEHVLDYFHVAMRVTVPQQLARRLPRPLDAVAPAIVATLESVRRFIWHGNATRALDRIEDLDDALDLLDHPPPQVRKLRPHDPDRRVPQAVQTDRLPRTRRSVLGTSRPAAASPANSSGGWATWATTPSCNPARSVPPLP
jgi:hypothetical protein